MNQSERLGNYQVFTAGKKVDGFRRTLTAVRVEFMAARSVGVGSQIGLQVSRSYNPWLYIATKCVLVHILHLLFFTIFGASASGRPASSRGAV